MPREHQRPLLQPGDSFDWIVGSDEPGAAHRIAQETSWALLERVRASGRPGEPARSGPEVVERVVRLAAGSGIDDIAELWASAGARSLAGQLWRLYLIHRVTESDPEGSVTRWIR